MKIKDWIALVALVLSLYILWRIRQVLLLTFFAVIIATVLNQLVYRLERVTHRRSLAVLITVASFLIVLSILIGGIGPPFVNQLQSLIQLIPFIIERIQSGFSALESTIPEALTQNLQDLNGLLQQLQSFDIPMLFDRAYTVFSNTLSIILNLLLIIVVSIMLLANPDPYQKTFTLLFPSSFRGQAYDILEECETAIVGWFLGIVFNMSIIAILSGIGLLVLGVNLALANALLAGLLAFIPNVGPVLSVIPPVAIALLDAPWKAIAVVILYIVVQQVESNILTPLVMKKQVSLLPALTLLSQISFSIFFGFLGLILALPLAIVGKIWIEELWVKRYLDQR
ncbi:MAG: AI-2E family transporter [Leptolyngbyaceae cyanobacterium SL_1_1]|nr:AI-2E family transporter [Leptolyngbyaceae cyanobacterium RM2_2_21]NJN01981.1 AI-2E family transporter [Leptolyngbyaceae cyanobacterium RM1_1_2]NJO10124.1 AI-2E family transporter [Leptolyngbyaceae cyanobacterium SL_1_1]